MSNRAIIPYRNSAIGGRPATVNDFIPRQKQEQDQPQQQHHQPKYHNNLTHQNSSSNFGQVNNNQAYIPYNNNIGMTTSYKTYQSPSWKGQSDGHFNPAGQSSVMGNYEGNNGYVHNHYEGMGANGQQGEMIGGFPAEMFQPKTTTYIRKLDPSEVFGENSEMGNDFDFPGGGIIMDQNMFIQQGQAPMHTHAMQGKPSYGHAQSSCKAIVPFKANDDANEQKIVSKTTNNGQNGNKSRSVVKLISPDQAEDDFHFSPEDFENGQTTYFPASALIQQFNPIKSNPYRMDKNESNLMNANNGNINGANGNRNGYMQSPNMHQQSFGNMNNIPYSNRMRSQSLDRKFTSPRRQSIVHTCGSPEYPNNLGYSNVHYEINGNRNLESANSCNDVVEEVVSDNRTTYGYAEFQAARQRFELNCKLNSIQPYQQQQPQQHQMLRAKKPMSGYRGSIANPYQYTQNQQENDILPLTNRSSFCNQASCNHMPASVHLNQSKDQDEIQQYVIAEEGSPGSKTKIFSFPAGEAPGDLTLLRAAVAANQPPDPFSAEDFNENDENEKIMPHQNGNQQQQQQMMRQQSQSFPYSTGGNEYMNSHRQQMNKNSNRNSISGHNAFNMSHQPQQQGQYNANNNNNMIPTQPMFQNMNNIMQPTRGNFNGGHSCKSMNPNMFNMGAMYQQLGQISNPHEGPYNGNVGVNGADNSSLMGKNFNNASFLMTSKNII